MIQLGISAFYHDAAACLVKDGKVLLAVEEERFTEVKHDASFPVNAIEWLLEESRIKITDIDEVCWYENPDIKKDRVLKTFNKRPFRTYFQRRKFLKEQKEHSPKSLLQAIGFTGPILYTDHHLSHSAFSFYTSNYSTAAILTVDGVGEWETVTISAGIGTKIHKHISIDFPNSLGMLYSTITAYLGFKPNEGEYKVMGLAPYGQANEYKEKLDKVFEKQTHNKFWINQKYFTWEYSDKIMFTRKLGRLLGFPPRLPEDPVEQHHKDLAAALQAVYEEQFSKLLTTAKNITKLDNICLGGGCAYNGVANVKAFEKFSSVHIPFAPSDAGSAIGACLYHYYLKDKTNKRISNSDPYLGPSYSNTEIKKAFKKYDNIFAYKLSEEKLVDKTADLLKNQNIVAWFQGRMEFGARALGNRSILASPSEANMRERLNYVIKKREGFRPFAPSVLENEASTWFDIKDAVPYMNVVCDAKVINNIYPFKAATHINGSCRVQTVNSNQNDRYFKLLQATKYKTGAGVLLNTSFNLKDQTITMTPDQAIKRFINSKINFLVIGNYLLTKDIK
jgi:carbamoyltransferase